MRADNTETYVHVDTGVASEEHPLMAEYRANVAQERARAIMAKQGDQQHRRHLPGMGMHGYEYDPRAATSYGGHRGAYPPGLGAMGTGHVGQQLSTSYVGVYAQQPPHPAAAAAFTAATGLGGDAERAAKEARRKERKERKEREQREAHSRASDGPLSPHRPKANAGNADKENAAAAEAQQRVVVKGLQRRVAVLEAELAAKDGELAAKEEAFENERMQLELEVNRAIIDKVETEKARLDEERAAMQADLRAAVELERQMAAEEAVKTVREAEADNARRRDLEAARLAAREEAITQDLTAERQRTSELIAIIGQQSRDLAKGGSDVTQHLVALEQAAAVKEAEARRVLEREREAMLSERAAELRAAEERGRAAAAAAAAIAADALADQLRETKRTHEAELAAAVKVAEATAATGMNAAVNAVTRELEDTRSQLAQETARRVELERLLTAAERRVEEAVTEATSRAASAANAAVASDAERALASERSRARRERARWLSTFVGMRAAIEQLRGTQDRLRAEALASVNAAGQGMAAALDAVGVLGSSARQAVDKFATVQRERRQLSNRLLELKGNIRVFLRIRPLSSNEISKGDFAALSAVSALEAQLGAPGGSVPGAGPGGGRKFEMDHVIGPETSQSEVFEEVEPLIRSVLDGYNVCIFAYGQTGSGKTHTMEGTETDRGITFRALSALFREASSEWAGYAYEFEVTMLEVYNDKVRDLLEPNPANPRPHDVRQGPNGAFVTDLEHVRVASSMDVMRVMRRGGAVRKTGRTNMNEHSSRSHLVFTIVVKGVNKARGETIQSRLNLVDLAGSERLSKTGATGERLAEAQHINKSLSALGNCMAALANRQQNKASGKSGGGHVPFRDCKLTHILSPCLGGDSKTLMFVHAGPAASNVAESACTLEFASRVRNIEMGPARKNVTGGDAASEKLLARAREELSEKNDRIAALTHELEVARGVTAH